MGYINLPETPLGPLFLRNEVRLFYLSFSSLSLLYSALMFLASVTGPFLSIPIAPPPPWGPSLAACSLPCGGLAATDFTGPSCDWAWLSNHSYARPSATKKSLGACAANAGTTKAPPTAAIMSTITLVAPLLSLLLGAAAAWAGLDLARTMAALAGGGPLRDQVAAAAALVARGAPPASAPHRAAWVKALHLVRDKNWPRHVARLWAAASLPWPLACLAATLELYRQCPPGAALGPGFALAAAALPLCGSGYALSSALRGRVARAKGHAETGADAHAEAALRRWLGVDDGGAVFRDWGGGAGVAAAAAAMLPPAPLRSVPARAASEP